MPLNAAGEWDLSDVLSGQDIRDKLEAAFGPLMPIERRDPSQPAIDYQFVDGQGTIGLINSVSQPFCGDCIGYGSLRRDNCETVCFRTANGMHAPCCVAEPQIAS